MPDGFFGHTHKWSKYEVVEQGDIYWGGDQRLIGKYFIQSRSCDECGYTEKEKGDV